ncbi:hypothetical protein IH879_08985 [candidate division KSB1 bacterium]|nr:hypothetical protein [candidate division KSB1 bacterium]
MHSRNAGTLSRAHIAIPLERTCGPHKPTFFREVYPGWGAVLTLSGQKRVWGFILAVIFAWSLKAALLEPFAVAAMMQVYFQTTDGEVSNPEWDEKLSRHWQPLRRLKLSDRANYPKPCDGFEPSEGCIELFNTQTNANLLREGQRFIKHKGSFYETF